MHRRTRSPHGERDVDLPNRVDSAVDRLVDDDSERALALCSQT
jgi:hypothetical protein